MAITKLSAPSLSFAAKVLMVLLVAMFALRMTPDSWGIKKLFSPTG